MLELIACGVDTLALESTGVYLRAAWCPDGEVCVVRALARQREVLLIEEASWVQRMQKSLVQMNIQRTEVLIWAGVDLTRINGLGLAAVMKTLSEIGPDLSRFETVKHFCSWLGLCLRQRGGVWRRLVRQVHAHELSQA